VKAVPAKTRRGLLQGVAILGACTAAAIGITGQIDTPTSNLAASATGSTTTSGTVSATGDAVDYRFGTIQLAVTETNGKITAIDLVQAGATGGREQAFSYLVDYAISANGTSFSNMSGATYTVDAFKQALTSAISKL
jgi:uncharacterized protein with FMN-binding domain